MNPSPTGYGGPSLRSDPCSPGISNTRNNHNQSHNIHGHSNQNIGNESGSYNDTINVGINEESLRIQTWLSPLEPYRRHQDVSNRRLDGVGNWVLQRNEFESWRRSQDGSGNPTLLCYGGQGVGKTHISSLVIDTLGEQARGRNIVAYSLYCDYQARRDQSAVNMIGSLLRQVALGAAGVPYEIRSAFRGPGQSGGKALRLRDMLKLFLYVISSSKRVYICVDAVDELLPQDRSDLLRAFRQMIQEAPNMRLFLTGRPHIRGEVGRHLTEGAYIINVVADKEDVASYLSRKMDDDNAKDPDFMTQNLQNDIMKTMLEKVSERFLLVALNIEAILGETSLAGRKKMLQKVASTGVDLDSVYGQTLQRIREQRGDRSRLGIEVLMWVSHAERPLKIEELRHALAVEMGATDLDPENIRSQDTVLGSCLGLVIVDQETFIVRLIHYTLQEYLSRPGVLPDAHRVLAQSCLAYLNYDQVRGLQADIPPNLADMPFLEYSSFYWGMHAVIQLSDQARTLALQLLNRYETHISATLVFHQITGIIFNPLSFPRFTGLHYASYFGIDEVLAALIDMKDRDINQGDWDGFTPLILAITQGNQGAVRLLLSCEDVNPNKPARRGQTPLYYASRDGREDIVGLLLARGDVNPNGSDEYWETPLSRASCNGHEGVVRLILARNDVNPDKPGTGGITPLCSASCKGHEGIVRVLLARNDVDPNHQDKNSWTPLHGASYQGHEGVVRLLLARDDVCPNHQDLEGWTPLSQASLLGYEGVVRLLLSRDDVDPDRADNCGRTPLALIAMGQLLGSSRDYKEIVRLLRLRTASSSSMN